MRCANMDPAKDQTRLSGLVGNGCKPQNLQHLLDHKKNAKSSKYTPMMAAALQCDPVWLATGHGIEPTLKGPIATYTSTPEAPPMVAQNVAQFVVNDKRQADTYWPWSVSRERIAALEPGFFGRLDGYIEGRVEEFERGARAQQGKTAS